MNTLTLRISNIPSSTTAESLDKLLQCLTVNSDDTTDRAKRPRGDNIHTISLAPSSSSADSDRYQVATVTFRKIPTELEPCMSHPRWVRIELGDGEGGFSAIIDSHFEGFTPLNNPPNPSVDIIAVTGLGGHAFGSWRSPEGPEMWLRDFMPDDLEHAGYHARVLTYGYDTMLAGSLSNASVGDLSKQFLELLKGTRRRPEERNRPIIFIGHSLGGLIIKKALREADYQNDDNRNDDIPRSCHGILFLGVPNQGLENSHLMTMVKGQPNSHLIEDLGARSQFLDLLNNEFCLYFKSKATKIVCYYELKNTPTVKLNSETKRWERKGTPVLMVTSESAIHPPANTGIALDADHSTIVKYSNSSEKNYQTIKLRILELVECTSQLKQGFSAQCKGKATERERECLRSLVPDNNNPSVRLPSRAKAYPGTCKWLLNDKTFKDWHSESMNNKSKLSWISGNPGTGKTVAMHFLLGELKKTSPTVCFFCDDKNKAQRTATAILKSLIHQLLRWNAIFFKHIMHEFEQFRQGERVTWSFDTLWRIFRDIACDPEAGPVCCLIDALDECEDDDSTEWSRSELLDRIIDLYSGGFGCRVRLIISSRPYHDLRSALGVFPTIPIHESTNGTDISNYINQKLHQSFKKGISNEVKREVADFLKREARGMFLWVALVIKDLSRDFTDASIRNRYKTLPRDLYGYYDDTLAKIPSDDHDRAKQMLMWIVYAAKPMTLNELNTALAISTCTSEDPIPPSSIQGIEPYKSHSLRRELAERCGLLVEIGGDWDFESGEGSDVGPGGDATVRLIHQSVKDFFTQSDTMKKSIHHRNFYTPPAQAHSLLAQSCIVFASFKEFGEISTEGLNPWGPVDFLKYPVFTRYCVNHWHYHLKQSESLLPITKKAFLNFHTSHVSNLANLISFCTGDFNEIMDKCDICPINVASALGIGPLVSFLVESGVDLEAPNSGGWTPLLWASTENQWEVVRYLVNHGADITAEHSFGTVLHDAAQTGSADIVRFLVERGADVYAVDELDGLVPLELALYSNNVVAIPLVESVTDKEEFLASMLLRGEPNYLNIKEGFLEMALHLIHHFADVNWRGDCGYTLLHYAYKAEICEALVEKGANVNATDSTGHTPLHYACDEQIGRFLVRNGANVHATNFNGETPLHTVSHSEVVGFLVQEGANVNTQNSAGNTPLHLARHEQIGRSLVRNGANVHATNFNGRTPLHTVGEPKVVKYLVQVGANVNATDPTGNTLLHVFRDIELAEILLQKGVDVNAKNSMGDTPLHAVWDIKFARFLVTNGANVHSRNFKGQTPLHTVHDTKVVKFLVKKGAELNSRGNGGDTALISAVRACNIKKVKSLVELGGDANIPSSNGETPLHIAIKQDNKEMVEFLVSCRSDPCLKGFEGVTSLENATWVGNQNLVRILQLRVVDWKTGWAWGSIAGRVERDLVGGSQEETAFGSWVM